MNHRQKPTFYAAPQWASATLGTFICIQCSGIHRSLGVHISFVRSVDMDEWRDSHVKNMLKWGNRKANAYWEAKKSSRYPKPNEMSGIGEIQSYITEKYANRRFVAMEDPKEFLEGWDSDEYDDEASSSVKKSKKKKKDKKKKDKKSKKSSEAAPAPAEEDPFGVEDDKKAPKVEEEDDDDFFGFASASPKKSAPVASRPTNLVSPPHGRSRPAAAAPPATGDDDDDDDLLGFHAFTTTTSSATTSTTVAAPAGGLAALAEPTPEQKRAAILAAYNTPAQTGAPTQQGAIPPGSDPFAGLS